MQGMLNIVAQGGLPKEIVDGSDPKAESPKKRGIKQGGILMLSSLILVPVLAMITVMLDAEPFLMVITAIVTFWGGFLRIMYALLFQSGVPTTEVPGFVESVRNDLTGSSSNQTALPPPQDEPIPASYTPPMGKWNETSDLQPTSVTEKTTRTLDKKEFPE